ncbi:hypothetical protein Q7P35_006635 [Cladosporium inversicolor]
MPDMYGDLYDSRCLVGVRWILGVMLCSLVISFIMGTYLCFILGSGGIEGGADVMERLTTDDVDDMGNEPMDRGFDRYGDAFLSAGGMLDHPDPRDSGRTRRRRRQAMEDEAEAAL